MRQPYITSQMINDLGYYFEKKDIEELFLTFINEEFYCVVGEELKKANSGSEVENNEMDSIISRSWSCFRYELIMNKENVMSRFNK